MRLLPLSPGFVGPRAPAWLPLTPPTAPGRGAGRHPRLRFAAIDRRRAVSGAPRARTRPCAATATDARFHPRTSFILAASPSFAIRSLPFLLSYDPSSVLLSILFGRGGSRKEQRKQRTDRAAFGEALHTGCRPAGRGASPDELSGARTPPPVGARTAGWGPRALRGPTGGASRAPNPNSHSDAGRAAARGRPRGPGKALKPPPLPSANGKRGARGGRRRLGGSGAVARQKTRRHGGSGAGRGAGRAAAGGAVGARAAALPAARTRPRGRAVRGGSRGSRRGCRGGRAVPRAPLRPRAAPPAGWPRCPCRCAPRCSAPRCCCTRGRTAARGRPWAPR